MIRASQRFTKGQRVELAHRVHTQGIEARGRTATVTGFARNDRFVVLVRHDGETVTRRYHMNYWQAIPTQEHSA